MRVEGDFAIFTEAEQALTGFESPMNINEIDLHALREEAVAELARIEREALWADPSEVPVENVVRFLGPGYERALARKLSLSKIAIEMAGKSGLDGLLDED